MIKGDIIQLETIDKQGFLSIQHLKVKDARIMKKLLDKRGYRQIAPNEYHCSHQYDSK